MKLSADQAREISDRASEYVFPFLTTITGVSKDDSIGKRFIGTASYIRFDGHTYIATARHVADHLSRFSYLFHGVGNSSSVIQGHWVATDVPEADFGVMGCFEEFLTESEKTLNCEDAIFSSNHSEDAYYLIIGFPEKLHTRLDFLNTHQHVATPIITRLRSIDVNTNNDRILFQLNYGKDLTDPPGMSGSPVWNLNTHLERKIDDWDVSKISFAGVVTRWNENNETIIATNAELIKEVLPAVTTKFQELYPRTDK